jgi:mRNA interferase HigB
MHVITRRTLVEFAQHHSEAKGPLEAWYRAAKDARWTNIRNVRAVFSHADAVVVHSGNVVTVFNVGGNKYRLAAAIHYNRQKVFVLRVMTHSEYSRDRWKDSL